MDHDAHIVARILAGEQRLFEVLLDRYKDLALTLATRLLGSREEGEEVVQDSFLKAFYALQEFRGDARFSTWLYRIVYNSCMTRVTRRRQRPGLLGDSGPDVLEQAADTDTLNALDSLEAAETQSIICEEMDRLPEKFRAVLTLYYHQEQRYEEIAAILDMPMGTVKTHLSRGRALLRDRVVMRLTDKVVAA